LDPCRNWWNWFRAHTAPWEIGKVRTNSTWRFFSYFDATDDCPFCRMFELWCLHIPVEDRTSFEGMSFSNGFFRLKETATCLFSDCWRKHACTCKFSFTLTNPPELYDEVQDWLSMWRGQ
jgi:hypothetical protein